MFVKDKVPALVKLAIANFLEHNAREIVSLWARVAEESPKDALKLYAQLAEFVLPRLSRTQLADSEDGQVTINVVTQGAADAVKHTSTGEGNADRSGGEVEPGHPEESRH